MTKVVMNDLVFVHEVQGKLVPRLLQEGETVSNLSRCMESFYQEQIGESGLADLRARAASRDEPRSAYDRHPPVSVRLDYARRFPTVEGDEAAPVVTLFDGWDGLNEKVAQLYNARLLMYIRASQAASAGQQQQTA